ncbi:short chain dehydrogenase/KR domain/NAD dependent epimerase/dehydratase family/Enoyl-(Acyl carrier protein) reductase, putative [Angomonas deanei]|uniref:Short chain dehydrogenase/KR domain/NAD dependent epimerase/dehydratase family/Enoyl-(Acyl carrier protein) reductase, putative n=1 Tax=Angomonas deanei TaxID=59799 RepID=A0A7G2CMV0_9TRYP|nr:short chain dehydrogenase/KR domain/NAD dependent epimerase/dehydratase family/Enoyl-(Acyl carrier protein) reductase, putative [Angomonas deanei]
MPLNKKQQEELKAKVDQRVILVTGASGGIGEGIVRSAYEHQFCKRFVLVARREEELKRVAASLPDADCLIVTADVTKEEDVKRVGEKALEHFGRVDVWVNNAGKGSTVKPSELQAHHIDEMIDVNVKSVLYGMHVALNIFKTNAAQEGGQIVNVSSLLARAMQVYPERDTSFRSAYGPSKAFVTAMTDAFRTELNTDAAWKDKIKISTVNPGPVGSDFGVNANGPPSAGQSVESCADAIYQLTLLEQRDEMYTDPPLYPAVNAYYERLLAAPEE